MTATVPAIEPTDCIAGESLTWTFAHADYPSGTWTLSYALIGADKVVWSSGWVTNGSDLGYTVLIPSSATTNLTGGSYRFVRSVTDGTTVKRWELSPLNIADNPLNLEAGTTRTAQLEADITALETAITARIAGDQPEKYAIGGMSVEKMTLDSLQRTLTQKRLALWRARNPGKTRQLAVRFSRASA